MRDASSDRVQSGGGGLSSLPKADGLVARLAYARVADAGIDPAPLLKKSGLSLQQIENRQTRISASHQVKFLTLAAEALKDDFLGISLALRFDLRELGLLYYVMASSATLGEALQRAARYSGIANEGVTLTCREGEEVVLKIGYVGISRHSDLHQMEAFATLIVRMCQQLSGRAMLPDSIRFMHHREKLPPPQKKALGSNVSFDAPEDELAFAKTIQSAPVRGADAYLNGMLVSYCEEALSRRATIRSAVRVDVENAIVPLLPHGQSNMREICRSLGMSNRTLSRRLEAEGLTFAKVLDNLRHDLAVRYLRDRDLSVSTIAWLLGYQEVSSFTHAFKRWTGKTPKQVRSDEQVASDHH